MNLLTRILKAEINLRPLQALAARSFGLWGRRPWRIQDNWHLVRLSALVHFLATLVVGGFALILGLSRIDSGISASFVEKIADVAAAILVLPLMPAYWRFGGLYLREWPAFWYPSLLIGLLLNSLLWGVGFSLFESQFLRRKSAPPSA